jgi:hypothetical protein
MVPQSFFIVSYECYLCQNRNTREQFKHSIIIKGGSSLSNVFANEILRLFGEKQQGLVHLRIEREIGKPYG